VESSSSYYLEPNFNHCLIKSLWITSQFKLTILVDVGKPSQHVCTGHSYLIEHDPAIVFLMVAQFGTDVSDLYSWKR